MVLYSFKTHRESNAVNDEQNQRKVNTKGIKNKTKNNKPIDCLSSKFVDYPYLFPLVLILIVSVIIIISVIIASIVSTDQITGTEESSSSSSQIVSNEKIQSHVTNDGKANSNNSNFYGMQENGLPERWEVTVNEENPDVDFDELYKAMTCSNFDSYQAEVYLDGERIASGIGIGSFMLSSIWPAYDCCNDTKPQTYELEVRVYGCRSLFEDDDVIGHDDSTKIGTVSLTLSYRP